MRALRIPAVPIAVRHAAVVLSIGYVTVASFPAAYYVLHPGLDISWVYGLNQFFNSQFRFGRDVNFTLGPLGFLLYPAHVGEDVVLAAAFRAAVALSFVAALAALSRGRALGAALFAVAYGAALALGQTAEFHPLIVAALAAVAAIEMASLPSLIAIAVLSAPLWLMKFSIGIGAATVVLAAAWAWRWLCGRPWRAALTIVLAHAMSLLATGWLVTGSLRAFVLWLRASVEIAGGYSSAMSLDPGWTDQGVGVAICALYLAACVVLWRLRRSSALPLLLLAGCTFLAFKAGFVREDSHVKSFFGFAVGSLAVPLLTAASARERIASAAALLLAAGLAVRVELRRHYLDGGPVRSIATGELGMSGIDNALHFRDTAERLDRWTAKYLAAARLPEEMRRAIGTGTVVILPWELVTCLADQLSCVPLATLQAYSAYTPYLDSITAAQFTGPARPDFVVVHTLGSTDSRHVVLDDPLTWRTLVDQYEPVRLRAEPVLLRRRASPSGAQMRPLSSILVRAGEWALVPRAAGFILAELEAHLSWPGSLVNLLHRIPATFIELRRASGAIERRRLILATSGNGILVQPFAARVEDLPALFDCSEGDRVVALRLTGPGLRYYRKEIDVRWLARPAQATAAADR